MVHPEIGYKRFFVGRYVTFVCNQLGTVLLLRIRDGCIRIACDTAILGSTGGTVRIMEIDAETCRAWLDPYAQQCRLVMLSLWQGCFQFGMKRTRAQLIRDFYRLITDTEGQYPKLA
jgi:hypothetical protein